MLLYDRLSDGKVTEVACLLIAKASKNNKRDPFSAFFDQNPSFILNIVPAFSWFTISVMPRF